MKPGLLISASALLATAGCAQFAPLDDSHGPEAMAKTSISVSVADGKVAVFPEVAPFIGDSNGVIKWTLVLDPSDYVFPDDGIGFSETVPSKTSLPAGCTAIGDPAVRFNLASCKPNNSRTEYQCTVKGNPHLSKSLCYFYVVKLVRVGGSGPPELVLDPWAKPK